MNIDDLISAAAFLLLIAGAFVALAIGGYGV